MFRQKACICFHTILSLNPFFRGRAQAREGVWIRRRVYPAWLTGESQLRNFLGEETPTQHLPKSILHEASSQAKMHGRAT